MSDIGIALKSSNVSRVGNHGYDMRKMSRKAWDFELKRLESDGFKLRCVICNERTRKYFGVPILGGNIFTINNKIPDGIIYLNNPF